VLFYRFLRGGDNSAKGIEYTWASCKNHFRNIVLDRTRGRENFKLCASESLSREILKTALVSKFSKHARRYIQGYHVLNQITLGHIETSDKDWQTNGKANLVIVPMKLKQMVKKFNTHRCAMDFNRAFCKTLFKEA